MSTTVKTLEKSMIYIFMMKVAASLWLPLKLIKYLQGYLVLNGTDSSSTNAGDNFDLEGATGITV